MDKATHTERQVKDLAMRAARGDAPAFGQIYDLFSQPLFNFILGRVRNRHLAEDLLHTVFLKAWNRVPDYRPQENAKFSTWLYQIANYTVIDHWRTRKDTAGIDMVENLAQFAVQPKGYETYAYLWEAMATLRDDYRAVLHLRFLDDLSVEETAFAMDKSAVGVRVLQHRALKALRKILQSRGYGDF
jgi:RNA polymerase sigma-70 factor, ECF subfamily